MAASLPIGWERSRSCVPRLPQGRVTWAHELTQARPDQGLPGSGFPQQQGRARPAHPVGVSRTEEPLRPPQSRRHHRVHGLGAHQVARGRGGNAAQAKGEKDRERAQTALKMSAYYEAARELATRLTRWSKELDRV